MSFPPHSAGHCSITVDGKMMFEKTLVLVFQHRRIQAERVGANTPGTCIGEMNMYWVSGNV
jgi:hypothetical protein